MGKYLFLLCAFTQAVAHPPLFTSVLDLDRMLLKQKHEVPEVSDKEYFVSVNGPYRIAAFAPEFMVALSRVVFGPGVESHIYFFSGGLPERNNDVAQNHLRLSRSITGPQILSGVFSFEDLIQVAEIPDGRTREDVKNRVVVLGQQDSIDFFSIFKKDLTRVLVGQRGVLEQTVIFEDNPHAVPQPQIPNLIVVARPDVLDEELTRPYSGLPAAKSAKKGHRDPVQVARARYRLVRAMGLLSLALDQSSYSLPRALDRLQWAPDGSFRAAQVNAPEVYQRGLDLLRRAYDRYLKDDSPAIARPESYFSITAVTPRLEDCGKLLQGNTTVPYRPWR